MPDGVFQVAVVTPEERLVDTEARTLVLRSSDGDLTVLDGHTPLVTDVVPGPVRVEPAEGEPVQLAVHGGYLQVDTGPTPGTPEGSVPVRTTRVTLLAGVAELRDQIDVARAERARDEAQAAVESLRAATGRTGSSGTPTAGSEEEGQSAEDIELVAAESALRRAEVRLEVAAPA
jgi:F-type H+-transporting ATPase subunit epsilon